ncbi:MAG: tRNA (adenosine(37)-N6)-threonylcarbamoyltransferase complex dimerization subunit type 1 TsaB [Chloroflexota bacterium]
MQLAIDTSTDNAGLALLDNDTVIFELSWYCRQKHTVELLPRLDYLLRRHNLNLHSVDAVIVALGPGSFNGLRAGISTAKGIAFSLGIPLVGISTLSAEAYAHAATMLPICPIMNIGREQIATALYRMKDGEWCQLAPEHITTLEALITETATRTLFCGEFIPAVADELTHVLKDKAVLPSPAARLRRATYLTELGQKQLKAGIAGDPATLQPIYLRRPSITRPKKR